VSDVEDYPDIVIDPRDEYSDIRVSRSRYVPQLPTDLPPRTRTLDERGKTKSVKKQIPLIATLLKADLSVKEISEVAGLSERQIERAIQYLDRKRVRDIRSMPDAERGKHLRILDKVIDRSIYGPVLRDEKGNVMTDKDGLPLRDSAKAADRRTVIAALDRAAKLVGLDAPSQSLNVNLSQRVVNRNAQQALMTNPEYRELVLRMEELERAASPQGTEHEPGPVRGIGDQSSAT
jgi:hypothetical protein